MHRSRVCVHTVPTAPTRVLLQEKLARRIRMVDVKCINPPRPGKKCLVLDIDYTLFDLVGVRKGGGVWKGGGVGIRGVKKEREKEEWARWHG